MMKKVTKNISLAIKSVVFACLGVVGLGYSAGAASVLPPEVTPPSEMPQTINPTSIITQGLQYLMYAIGVISVVMIIIGGIRYATSGGSADKVKSAKNTILYACVGLAVALLALAIVTFVQNDVVGGLGGVSNTSSTSSNSGGSAAGSATNIPMEK